MTKIIHMDIEPTEDLAQSMVYSVTDMLDTLGSIRSQVRRLDHAWSGGRSNRIISDMERALREIETNLDEIDRLTNRARAEIQEWQEQDATGSPVWNFVKENWQDITENIAKLGVAGYIATHLGTSLLRPNSVTIHAPDLLGWAPKAIQRWLRPILGKRALREFIGINPYTNVIMPKTLAKTMTRAATVAAVAIDVAPQIVSDYEEYGWSERFASAAVVDFAVKGGLALGGVLAVGAVLGAVAGAPLVVAGGAVILTAVGVGILSDAIWGAFEGSGLREQWIEGGTRFINDAKNILGGVYQSAADRVQNAFQGAITSITNFFNPPAPASAT